MSYVYIRSEPGLWTVGHYSPDGEWHTDSDHGDQEEAAARVAYLNGAPRINLVEEIHGLSPFGRAAIREALEP